MFTFCIGDGIKTKRSLSTTGWYFFITVQEEDGASLSSSSIKIPTLSRGEKLVQLAQKPVACEGTFVVNVDGSLSKVDSKNEQLVSAVDSNYLEDKENCLNDTNFDCNLLSKDIILISSAPTHDTSVGESDDFIFNNAASISTNSDKILQNISGLLEDFENEYEEQFIIEGQPGKPRVRKKHHQVKPEDWKMNKSKTARKLGQKYYGKKKLEDGKWKYDIKKKERAMKPRCLCKSKEKGLLQCSLITENDRKKIFEEFWSLDWQAKKIYVQFLAKKTKPKRARNRIECDKSRRKCSGIYFLKKGNTTVRVCKTLFLNTLAIGSWTAQNWQSEPDGGSETDDPDDELSKSNEDLTGSGPKKLRKSKEILNLEDFFQKLPKVESHYCRISTKKLYIEPNWTSKRELYMFYKNDWCEKKHNIDPVSICTFTNKFEENNLGLFRPKKDLCDKCESFKTGNLETEDYEAHIMRKEESRMEKNNDKDNKKYLTFTMDLQALLMCPKSTVSSLYYKMKLSVHNMTFFNLDTKDGYCFLWNETEGCLSSNEFGSIISNFVLSLLPLPTDKEKIILYSDGCAYQNRSTNICNALLHIAVTKKVIIEQKYLEVGHTQMEADSIHSTIERRLRFRSIQVPADYIAVIKEARISQPYLVQYIEHGFFKSFDDHLFYKSVRPGKGVGAPCVTDVRAFLYHPEGIIKFKFNFSDEWSELPQRKITTMLPTDFHELPNLHKTRITIKKRKYNDLQELKTILPADYHSFYDDIPFIDR